MKSGARREGARGAQPVKGIGIHLFWLIFLAAATLRVTLTSLGPLMESIQKDLALSATVVSLLISIPVICMGFFALLAKPLSDRIGLERTLTLSLFAIALSTFFRTHYHSVSLLIISSFVMGAGIAIAGPLASGFVKRYFGKESHKGMMLYSLGISVSGSIGALSAWIFSEYFGWSWAFSLEFWTIPILLISGYWAYYFLFTKSESTAVIQEQKVRLPWNKPKAWLLILCFGIQSGLFYTVVAWLLPYLKESGISDFHANLLLNIVIFNGLLGSIIVPYMLKNFPRKFTIYSVSIFVMILFALLLLVKGNLVVTYITIFFLGMFVSAGLFTITLTLPFYEVDSGNGVASWTAMMLFGGYIISAIIPTLFGSIYDITNSYESVFIGLLLCSVVLFISFFLFLNSKNKIDA